MKRVVVVPLVVIISLSVLARGFDWERAVSLYKQGQFGEAITEFQKVLAEYPEHADSWKFIGLSYYQLKEFEQAIPPLEKSLELKRKESRTDFDLYRAIGQSYLALNQYEKSLPYFERLVSEQANVAINYHFLGVTYANLNRPEEAAAAFSKASKLDPKDTDSWYYLGVQQYRTGQIAQAIITLRNGLAADPKNPEMLGLLTESLLRQAASESDAKKAGAMFEEAVQFASKLKSVRDDGASSELLGRAYLATKKYALAETQLTKALENSKQPTAALYFNLGFALAQNKIWQRAAEMFGMADKLNPGDVNTLYYLGYVYENLRQYPLALAAYTRAFEAGGRNNQDLKASVERVTPLARP